jgi:hypothetical protein
MAAIGAGIDLVADTDMAAIDDRSGTGERLAARQVPVLEIGGDSLAQLRKGGDHVAEALELAALAHLIPVGMVAMLDTAGIVAPRCLKMGARIGGYADVLIGRRNRQRTDAGERLLIGDPAAVGVAIAEIAADPDATDSQIVDGRAAQSGRTTWPCPRAWRP